MNITVERVSTQTQIVGPDVVFLDKLIAAFADREIAGAEGDEPNLRRAVRDHLGFGNKAACGLKFARQALHVVLIVIRTLAVLRLFVVTAAPREISSSRMF